MVLVLKTPQDYQKALIQLQELWNDPEKESPQASSPEELIKAIDAYEENLARKMGIKRGHSLKKAYEFHRNLGTSHKVFLQPISSKEIELFSKDLKETQPSSGCTKPIFDELEYTSYFDEGGNLGKGAVKEARGSNQGRVGRNTPV